MRKGLDLHRRQARRPGKKDTVLMLLMYRCDQGTPVARWQCRRITAKEAGCAFLGMLYQDFDPSLQGLVSPINLDIKVEIQTMTGADLQGLGQALFAKWCDFGVRPGQHRIETQFGGANTSLLPRR